MKVSDYYGSKWLSNEDLDEDKVTVVTIQECYEAEFDSDDDDETKKPSEVKIAVQFDEFEKALLLNKTNAGTIVSMYGNDTEEWIGQRIGLYVTDVQFGKKMVPAIRVKSRAPKPAPKSARSSKRAASKTSKRTAKRSGTRRRNTEPDDEE